MRGGDSIRNPIEIRWDPAQLSRLCNVRFPPMDAGLRGFRFMTPNGMHFMSGGQEVAGKSRARVAAADNQGAHELRQVKNRIANLERLIGLQTGGSLDSLSIHKSPVFGTKIFEDK
jgi:hypothetical protein